MSVRRGGSDITARAVVLIAGLGVMALGLLSLRQQRLQAMHELAATRLRQGSHDARLWALRSEIAALVTPERIGTMSPEAGR